MNREVKTEQPLKNNTNEPHTKIKPKIHKNGQKSDLNCLISKNREKTEAHTIENLKPPARL